MESHPFPKNSARYWELSQVPTGKEFTARGRDWREGREEVEKLPEKRGPVLWWAGSFRLCTPELRIRISGEFGLENLHFKELLSLFPHMFKFENLCFGNGRSLKSFKEE